MPAAPASPTQASRAVVSPLTTVAIVAVGAYVGAQLLADVASLKIGVVAGRAVDMGTFVYPITFTLRDVVHKTLGRRAARTVVFTAAAMNLVMAGYLGMAAAWPAHSSFGLSEEFSAILGPLWRITFASIVAEVLSELCDTEVYHWFVTRVTAGHQWARVVVSNAISIPLDNAVFVVLAFGALPGLADNSLTLPWASVWDIFVVNLAVKLIVGLLSVPLIYLTPDRDWSADPDDA